jgi:hypothetical protein
VDISLFGGVHLALDGGLATGNGRHGREQGQEANWCDREPHERKRRT